MPRNSNPDKRLRLIERLMEKSPEELDAAVKKYSSKLNYLKTRTDELLEEMDIVLGVQKYKELGRLNKKEGEAFKGYINKGMGFHVALMIIESKRTYGSRTEID